MHSLIEMLEDKRAVQAARADADRAGSPVRSVRSLRKVDVFAPDYQLDTIRTSAGPQQTEEDLGLAQDSGRKLG